MAGLLASTAVPERKKCVPTELKESEVPEKGLGHNHLSTAQHAAPALVRGQPGVANRRKVAPVRYPQATSDKCQQLLVICR